MTDHDMRALALNLAHSEGGGSVLPAALIIEKAQAYYGFLSGRDEAKAIASANVANALNPGSFTYVSERNIASMMTSAEIQEAMRGARGE